MATKIIKAQLTQRRDTAANWERVNPVLLPGELGFISDDDSSYKIGDGIHAWNDLPLRGLSGITDEEKAGIAENLAKLSAEKADKNGKYADLTAGDLYGHGESVPAEFSFRASGGKSIKDGNAYIKEVHGNAVVWNQMFKGSHSIVSELNGLIIVNNNDGSYTISGKNNSSSDVRIVLSDYFSNRVGDIYLLTGCPKGGSTSTYRLEEGYSGAFDQGDGRIGKYATSNHDSSALMVVISANYEITSPLTFRPRTTNLTKMFGAGYEPSTIEDFYKLRPIGVDLNSYNEGEVIPFNAQGIKSVGDNAWDEQWELGNLSVETGGDIATNLRIRTKDYIQVIGGESYVITMGNASRYSDAGTICYYDNDKRFISATYPSVLVPFAIPANAKYIRIGFISTYGTTYKNDITISLYHSGWKAEVDNTYKPYWDDTLMLDSRIKAAFPNGMMPWDKVYNKDGKGYAVKGAKRVKLKDLTWKYSNSIPAFYAIISDMQSPTTDKERLSGVLSNRFMISSVATTAGMEDKSMLRFPNSYLYVKALAYTDVSSLVASFTDEDILCYELADPIVSELGEELEMDYKVADFGTEEIIGDQPSAAFKGRTIYQFNAVDQIRENYNEIEKIKAKLETILTQLSTLNN